MSYYQYEDAPFLEPSIFDPYRASGGVGTSPKGEHDFQALYPRITTPELDQYDPLESPNTSASSEALGSPRFAHDFPDLPSILDVSLGEIQTSPRPDDCVICLSSLSRPTEAIHPSQISSYSELAGALGKSPPRIEVPRVFGSPSGESDKENIPPPAAGRFDDAPGDDTDDEDMEFVISYRPMPPRRDTTLLPISSVRPPVIYAPTPIHSLIPSLTSFETSVETTSSPRAHPPSSFPSPHNDGRPYTLRYPTTPTTVCDSFPQNTAQYPRQFLQSSMRDLPATRPSPERFDALLALADAACLVNQ
ncbi:hypothetical protein SISSUDRAFT_1052286 [Sistotremastrum suecicum HHB10207 ss-3]|uniref:Uncharacterized protein n=1 Tax=Sistotremastrum suecicum HHB10207 ss-3 TaxID=1314776 RepID=A0A165ZZX1_9AGAM|nr:hypothetical protein SISSUDRAFT_1052286 [Sistotremastrum suecicum HHB10207 ss-3]